MLRKLKAFAGVCAGLSQLIERLEERDMTRPIFAFAPVLTVAAALSCATSSALATVVNFDVFPGGGVVPNNTVIGSQYSSLGVLFSSSAPAGGPTAAFFTGEASSGPNFLVGIDPGSGAGLFPIQMDFTAAGITSVSFNALSIGTGNIHCDGLCIGPFHRARYGFDHQRPRSRCGLRERQLGDAQRGGHRARADFDHADTTDRRWFRD